MGSTYTAIDKWVVVILTVEVFPWPRWLLVIVVAAVIGAIECSVRQAWKRRS